LKLYALYKQGSVGEVTGKRPGFTDFKGRAKYDAWDKLKGTSQKKGHGGLYSACREIAGLTKQRFCKPIFT